MKKYNLKNMKINNVKKEKYIQRSVKKYNIKNEIKYKVP